ncbi:MAG: winged helix-turn-helix transcriptional regulator [Planctomycetaceae bacterium]|nr:winged helix-turn-helix transcriptional regulator [Planctomycetaceae bacterium]
MSIRPIKGEALIASKTKSKPVKPPGSVESFAEAAECLKTLAHPVRLRIVQLLLHGRYTVGELAEDCSIADNAMSDHLRLLQRCGFLTSERDGRRVYYQVAEAHLQQLMVCIEGRFLPCGAK